MIMKYVKGDILTSNADAILHQVNCKGVMGAGLAKQIKEQYPEVFDLYKTECNIKNRKATELLGQAQAVCVDNNSKYVVNLFAQDRYGRDGKCYTDYNALRECLEQVNLQFKDKSVAIPYLMGCGLAGGDWSVVSKIIEETLVDCDVILYEYCKEKVEIDTFPKEPEEKCLYVHYGHREFDINEFCEIKNKLLFNKPIGGFWASPIDAKYSWKDFNESVVELHGSDAAFSIREDCSFKFTLSSTAKVLVISSVADVEKLPTQVCNDERLKELVALNENTGHKSIDFEALKNSGYDAVELKFSNDDGLYQAMFSWDCDSIVILNPDVIEPVLKKEKHVDTVDSVIANAKHTCEVLNRNVVQKNNIEFSLV